MTTRSKAKEAEESKAKPSPSHDYLISQWGDGFFSINKDYHVAISPNKKGKSIDLYSLVESLVKRGIKPPILLRINGIIAHRIREIYAAFQETIKEFDYQAEYKLAFPIKVNQQKHVVDLICQKGFSEKISFEVGSKPELTVALPLLHHEDSLLICNGYKDADYIELALLARKLRRRVIIIVERRKEISLVLKIAKKLGLDFEVGLRMKPVRQGSGRWSSSAGENAKFGLTAFEVMEVIEELKEAGKLDSLILLHFHIGSQVTSIYSIKRVLQEGAVMFAELFQLVPSLRFFDIGGGLGIDYVGTRSSNSSSINYTLEEYARDVVFTIMETCKKSSVPPPTIISESGRALLAYHSILIAEVVDAEGSFHMDCSEPPLPDYHDYLKDLFEMFQGVQPKNCREVLHDSMQIKETLDDLFQQRSLSLREKAYGDKMIKILLAKIIEVSKDLERLPEELANLPESIFYTYFCNFSIFQSLPDSWALKHLFPIMPIHRLDEEPSCRAILADLTCDSDGLINEFIGDSETQCFLRLHPLKEGESYYLGAFLVGAYQETLGALHNLFGDTNAIHVELKENGEVSISDLVEGDSIGEVLSYFQYGEEDLISSFNRKLEQGLQERAITYEESFYLRRAFRKSLESYTYLVRDNTDA